MRRAGIVLLILLGAGCQAAPSGSGDAIRAEPATAGSSGVAAALVKHVWMRSDATAPPGDMRIFRPEGTLVMDSCFETYRLAPWRMESDSTVAWQEDGVEIRARIVTVTDAELVLRVSLAHGSEDQHYGVATVPFVCPDMPR